MISAPPNPSPVSGWTRRRVIGAMAGAAALLATPRPLRAAAAAGEPLRLAFIGVGGQGRNAVRSLTDQRCVAFADVDDLRAAATFAEFPAVPRYRDFRVMLDRHAREIDGIVISTPDHLHHPMAIAALQAGKHVYLEKPLAPTIWECRQLQAAAAAHPHLRTQTGVHGHSFEALRVLREWLDAGAAGRVHTVCLWSNRLSPDLSVWSEKPAPEAPVPATLDWDLWLGPRPARPYSPQYLPLRWRNWWQLGSGALGDIAVHMFDTVRFALDLGFPALVEADVPARSRFTAPPWSRVRWAFPAHGDRPPVEVRWVNGTRDGHLLKPAEIPRLPADRVAATPNGMAFVGDAATLFIPDMRASSRPRLYPPERERDFLAAPPPRTLPRPKGDHYQDWINAIRENRAAGAPFAYGAPLTETVLLGTLAQQTGSPIRWDPEKMRATGAPEADALIKPPIRPGWEYTL